MSNPQFQLIQLHRMLENGAANQSNLVQSRQEDMHQKYQHTIQLIFKIKHCVEASTKIS